ncbi:MAG: hypothetical protein JJ936_15020 [Psychroserpens sp.]|nr:hypothetical protein [Psychroserpens sp.]
MGVRFGEIDSGQILQNEFRISVLEKVVEVLMNANPNVAAQIDMSQIRSEVIRDLQGKYPNSGIELME